MPITFEMTNWTDTTLEVTANSWTDDVLDSDGGVEWTDDVLAMTEAPTDGGYTFTNRHVAMAIVPHITGLLSILGSSFIVLDVFRKRFKTVYDRLLFGLAVSDIIASIGMALSTWPVPEYQGQKTYGAVGSLASCEFQGFFIQLGLATPLYSAFLSLYYILLVKFNYRPNTLKMLRFEKAAHGVSLSLALITAVASLALKQYNNANVSSS